MSWQCTSLTPGLLLRAESHLQHVAGTKGVLRLPELAASQEQRQVLAAVLRLACGSQSSLRAAAVAALEACIRPQLQAALEQVLTPAAGCWGEVLAAHQAMVQEAQLWSPQRWLQQRCAAPLLQQLSWLLLAADASDEVVDVLAPWVGGPGGLWAWLHGCLVKVSCAGLHRLQCGTLPAA
jgi:hypothetical protein